MATLVVGKAFPRPSLTLFAALQTLDIVTTLIGLRMGASEGSVFIAHLMRVGPSAGLAISKIFAVVLVMIALKFRRPRAIVFLNYWSAMVVTWNLIMIVLAGLGGARR